MREEIFVVTNNDRKIAILKRVLGYPVRRINNSSDEKLECLSQHPLIFPLKIVRQKLKEGLKNSGLPPGEYVFATDTLGFGGPNFSIPLGKPQNFENALKMAMLISSHGVVNVAATAVGISGDETRIASGGVLIWTPGLKDFTEEEWQNYAEKAGERIFAAATGIDLGYGGLFLAKPPLVECYLLDGSGDIRLEQKIYSMTGSHGYDFSQEIMEEIGEIVHGMNPTLLEILADKIG